MCNFNILYCNCNFYHRPFYRYLIPNIANKYILFYFTTSVILVLNGKQTTTEKNSFLIVSPESQLELLPNEKGFLHSWIDFEVDDTNIFRTYSLQLDTIYYLEENNSINNTILKIKKEEMFKLENYLSYISLQMNILFIELGRLVSTKPFDDIQNINTRVQLDNIKLLIYSEPHLWSVKKILQTLYISRSQLYMLYRKYYGTSPSKDILNAKFMASKDLLVNTNLSITQISNKLGYSSDEAFIKQFSKTYNVSPNMYRKMNKGTVID